MAGLGSALWLRAFPGEGFNCEHEQPTRLVAGGARASILKRGVSLASAARMWGKKGECWASRTAALAKAGRKEGKYGLSREQSASGPGMVGGDDAGGASRSGSCRGADARLKSQTESCCSRGPWKGLREEQG